MKRRRKNMKQRTGRKLEYVAYGQWSVQNTDPSLIKAGEKASMLAKQKNPSKNKLRRAESRKQAPNARKFQKRE